MLQHIEQRLAQDWSLAIREGSRTYIAAQGGPEDGGLLLVGPQ